MSKNNNLSNKALLAQVTISQWQGRKVDRTATETVIKSHKASRAAGNYSKRLLPSSVELELISAISSQVRSYFHENTLPWLSDGSRIIKSEHHLNFTKEMRRLKREFEQAVNAFLANYSNLKLNAKNSLGELYIESEYPTIEELTDKFGIDVTILPMPDIKDFRTNLSDEDKRDFITKLKTVEQKALKDAFTRLHDVVKAAADRLSSDTNFKDSLIVNIKDLCALLPMLNINDDKELDDSRKEVEKLVDTISIQDIRNDKTSRKDTAKKLKDITDKLSIIKGV